MDDFVVDGLFILLFTSINKKYNLVDLLGDT